MLVDTKVKMSRSEKKKGEQEHIRHFHFVVVQDNGNCIGYFNEV